MSIETNLSALGALGTRMAVTANNIANMNTNEFRASRAHLETGPQDQGVRVADIRESTAPGPMVPSLERVEDPDTGRVSTEYQYVEGSNTDLAREMVDMISTQHAYDANAAVIRTESEMHGTVLNLIA